MTVTALIKRMIGAKSLTGFSADRYWEQRHRTFRDSHEAVGHIGLSAEDNAAQYAAKRDLILDAIERHLRITPATTLLDAGCGIGLLTRQFVASGFTVVGVDFCTGAVDRARSACREAEFIVATLSTLQLERTFDVVVVADVLLHVVDESEWRRTLAALTDHVATGGALVILDWFEEQTDRLGPHVCPRAVERYREALDAVGCDIVEHQRFCLDHEPGTKDLIVVRRRA